MRRSIKIGVLIVAIVMLATNSGHGQGGETERSLDRQVDVSRDYAPDVGKAEKLAITPNMGDTVMLRPQFDYSIRPSAWTTGFGVTAINPVMIDASKYDPTYPFYLKLGAGVPLQSLLDFYAISSGRKGFIGGYINHNGRYSKIKNDLGKKERANRNINRIGVIGKREIGYRIALEGELGVNYNYWSRYGFGVPMDASHILSDEVQSQRFFMPHAKLTIGNSFNDLSYFNFRAGGSMYLLKDKKRDNNSEFGANLFVEVGKMFSVHKLTLKASIDAILLSRDALDGWEGSREYDDNVFALAPRYGIETKRFKLTAGADFALNIRTTVSNKVYVLPQFDISFDVVGGWLVPYVSLDSRMVNNGYRSLTDRNPYINGSVDIPEKATREYNLRGGIRGTVSTNFSYRIYAGASIYKNPVFSYPIYFFLEQDQDPNDFLHPLPNHSVINALQIKSMNMTTVGGELEGRISGSFMAGLSANIYWYSKVKSGSSSGINDPIDCPKYDASLYVRYNYRDKFSIKASASIVGKRGFLDVWINRSQLIGPISRIYINHLWEIPNQNTALDLGIEAEYNISRGFGVFVSGQNLTNSKLYRFQSYPDFGIGVLGGIKLVF